MAVRRTSEHERGDKRGAARVTLLIRAAKIVHPGGEFLCVVHTVSETGVRLRLFHPLPVRSDLTSFSNCRTAIGMR